MQWLRTYVHVLYMYMCMQQDFIDDDRVRFVRHMHFDGHPMLLLFAPLKINVYVSIFQQRSQGYGVAFVTL